MLLTDIVMANGNGFDLGQKALNKNPALPVLYMTGFVEQAAAHGENLAPDTIILSKPFSVRELLIAVRTSLANAN